MRAIYFARSLFRSAELRINAVFQAFITFAERSKSERVLPLPNTEKHTETRAYKPRGVSKNTFAQKINEIDLIFKVFRLPFLYNKDVRKAVFLCIG